MTFMGVVILDAFYGPRQVQFKKEDKDILDLKNSITQLLLDEINGRKSLQLVNHNVSSITHTSLPLPTFALLERVLRLADSVLSKFLFLPVSVHSNYCDHKKPWLEEKGVWLVKSYNFGNSPCLRCLALRRDQTWYAHQPWKELLQKAWKEMDDIRSIPINTPIKIGKVRDIFLVTEDSLRAFDNGMTFLNKGFHWKDIKKIPYQYFYFFDKYYGEPIRNETVISLPTSSSDSR